MKKFFLTALMIPCLMAGCCTQNNDGACEAPEKSVNPVIDAIMARRSIRHYTDTPVEREKLQTIAECGINAPNVMNRQEWEVRIIDDEKYFNELTDIIGVALPPFVNKTDPKFRNAFRNATAAIFIACPDDEHGMLLQNVGLMSENICLAAQSLGLGTCVMGGPAVFLTENETAKPYLDMLGFSEGYKLRTVIAVGYPDETPEAKPRDKSKIKFIELPAPKPDEEWE